MKLFKNLLIFLAGGGVGAGIGFYVAKSQIEKRLDGEVEEVRNYYAEELEKLKEENEHLNKVMESAASIAAKALSEDSGKEPKKKKKQEEKSAEDIIQKMDYAEISASKKKTTSKKKVDPDIFVITAEDFKELNGYDKTTLTYFPDEDRFLDDMNADYDDGFEEVGGSAILEQFEDGYLYVRNRFTQTDYEVIRELRSFKRYMSEEMGE